MFLSHYAGFPRDQDVLAVKRQGVHLLTVSCWLQYWPQLRSPQGRSIFFSGLIFVVSEVVDRITVFIVQLSIFLLTVD